MFVQVLLVAFTVFIAAEARALNTCSSNQIPCRYRTVKQALNGTLLEESTGTRCNCSSLNSVCSNDWNNADRVISVNRYSEHYNLTHQYMFCNNVVPQRTCTSADSESLDLFGSLILSSQLNTINCRCSSRKPYLLKRSYWGSNHLKHEAFSCPIAQPLCPANYQCLLGESRQHTTFYCQCPAEQHCYVETPDHMSVKIGFCRAIRPAY